MVRGLGKLKTRVDLQRNMKRAGCVGGGVGRSVMLKGRNTRCCCPKAVWCKDSTTGKTRLVAAGECGEIPELTIIFLGRVADKSIVPNTAATAAKTANITVPNGFAPASTLFAHDQDWIRVTITSDEELKGPPTVEFFVNGAAGAGTTTVITSKAGFVYEAIYEIDQGAGDAEGARGGAQEHGAAARRAERHEEQVRGSQEEEEGGRGGSQEGSGGEGRGGA